MPPRALSARLLTAAAAAAAAASFTASAPAAGAALLPPPSLRVLSADAAFVVGLARPPAVFTEMPPTLLRIPAPGLAGGGGCPRAAAGALALYLSTAYVGLCLASNATALPTAPGAPPLGLDDASCSVPFSGESWRNWPPDAVPPHTEWLRNYDGVMAALPLGGAGGSASLLVVRHGEHKNELCWANDLLYQGLINADVDARECYSGFQNGTGPYVDCNAAYNAFVSGASLPFSPATCFGLGEPGNASAVDLGPLVWPVGGYLNASGGKRSYGVRQPGALVAWDGAAVLMWIDNGFDTADVWVARSLPVGSAAAAGGAHVAAAAAAAAAASSSSSSLSFAAYDAAAGAWSLPTLPAGFDARNVMASLQAESAAASRGAPAFVLAPDAGAVHASAARLTVGGAPSGLHIVVYDLVNYTECFGGGATAARLGGVGVGTRLVGDVLASRGRARRAAAAKPTPEPAGACVPPWRLFLRVTADFVTFSAPVELERFASPGWPAAPLAYATLLSADGARQDEVAAEGFFVLGTCAQAGGACGATDGPLVTAARVSVAVGGGGSW